MKRHRGAIAALLIVFALTVGPTHAQTIRVSDKPWHLQMSDDGSVLVLRLPTRTIVYAARKTGHSFCFASEHTIVSPDGKQLATLEPSAASVQLLDVKTRTIVGSYRARTVREFGGNRGPVFSPDGKQLAFLEFGPKDSHDGWLTVIELRTGQRKKLNQFIKQLHIHLGSLVGMSLLGTWIKGHGISAMRQDDSSHHVADLLYFLIDPITGQAKRMAELNGGHPCYDGTFVTNTKSLYGSLARKTEVPWDKAVRITPSGSVQVLFDPKRELVSQAEPGLGVEPATKAPAVLIYGLTNPRRRHKRIMIYLHALKSHRTRLIVDEPWSGTLGPLETCTACISGDGKWIAYSSPRKRNEVVIKKL